MLGRGLLVGSMILLLVFSFDAALAVPTKLFNPREMNKGKHESLKENKAGTRGSHSPPSGPGSSPPTKS
ncbi:hypothetical protein MANES_15G144032v8 [Manihot esculenta]|uniref:RNA helicase n=1 Tax=Manihot esculenta TaxID=3983 RepID=A0A2C9UH63_MANES|nr:hypothetical protein MANES_15G144032v8 [Manihot esculenta]